MWLSRHRGRAASIASALSLRTTLTFKVPSKIKVATDRDLIREAQPLRNHCSRGLFELVENRLLDLEMEALLVMKLAGQLKSQL